MSMRRAIGENTGMKNPGTIQGFRDCFCVTALCYADMLSGIKYWGYNLFEFSRFRNLIKSASCLRFHLFRHWAP